MYVPFRPARFSRSVAVLLLACLCMAVAAPSAWSEYDAGKRALEAGQPDKAASEWRAAAHAGDRRAMLALGRLYARGLGVAQDYVEAHKWFNLAASRGEAQAARERDAVAAKMTPVQVAGAQEKAKAWRPHAGRATSPAAVPRTAAPARSRNAAAIEASLGLTPADRRLVQSGLASLGFRPGPADGVFGAATRAALRAWQRANGAAETGRLTASAATALAAAGERAAKARQAAREKAEKAAGEKAERAAREAAEKAARAAALRPGRVFRDCSDCPEMVVVPAGSFMMGSPAHEAGRFESEGPQRRVTISKPFAVGKFEVTRDEFARFAAATGYSPQDKCYGYNVTENWQNPGFRQSGRHPVTCITWHEAKAYVGWLSNKTGKRYRLLSDSEWEYAARAGTKTRFFWGDEVSALCSFGNIADAKHKEAHYWREQRAACDDGATRTAPVGRYRANRFGLYDMIGNVSEWVEDCDYDYSNGPTDGSARITGVRCGKQRIMRGGSWNTTHAERFLRVAFRSTSNIAGSYFRYNTFGFRVAQTLTP